MSLFSRTFILMQIFAAILYAVQTQEINLIDATETFDDSNAEFISIKNQLVKQFYAEVAPANLQKIVNMVGCKDANCPALIDISSISFVIYNTIPNHFKKLINIGERLNKNITNTVTEVLVNNGTSKLELDTALQHLDVTQTFEVKISKTGSIIGAGEKPIPFTANENINFNFTRNDVETGSRSQPFTVYAMPKKIPLEPMTRLNVTFNYYQFEQNIDYAFDFELVNTSTIKHLTVDAAGNVLFGATPLVPFLQAHAVLVKGLQYPSINAIRLETIAENRFVLKNFPVTEKITSFGVDVVQGKPEHIEKEIW